MLLCLSVYHAWNTVTIILKIFWSFWGKHITLVGNQKNRERRKKKVRYLAYFDSFAVLKSNVILLLASSLSSRDIWGCLAG